MNEYLPTVIIPIIGPNTEDALKDMVSASSLKSDIVNFILEVRFDTFKGPDFYLILTFPTLPFYVTNRIVEEGGSFKWDEEERIEDIIKAYTLGVDYFDIEQRVYTQRFAERLRNEIGSPKIMLSNHFNDNYGIDYLKRVYDDAKKKGAYLTKIITKADNYHDLLVMLNLISEHPGKIIGHCTGKLSGLSRILSTAYGSAGTFGYINPNRKSDDSQISVRGLVDGIRHVQDLIRMHKLPGISDLTTTELKRIHDYLYDVIL